MNKKYLQTLIALAILAALRGIFTYYGRTKSAPNSESNSVESKKILPVNDSQIVAFTVKATGDKPVTCTREGSEGQITEPEKLATDSASGSSFLTSLTSAAPDEVISEQPGSLNQFGLDPPATTITVRT